MRKWIVDHFPKSEDAVLIEKHFEEYGQTVECYSKHLDGYSYSHKSLLPFSKICV